MSNDFESPPPPGAAPGKGKKVVIDDRPLWKKKRFLIPAILVGLMIAAAAAGGGGSGDSSSTGSTSVANTGRTAISFEEIVNRSNGQTDAQWEKFADELKADYRAEGWVGYVIDVREQALGDDYYAQLSTDPDGILSDFNKDLSADEALALSKGDRLVVSGDIKQAYRIGNVSIELAK